MVVKNFEFGMRFFFLFPFDISKLIQPEALKTGTIQEAGFTLNVVEITLQSAVN
jgi:hypothetical protein